MPRNVSLTTEQRKHNRLLRRERDRLRHRERRQPRWISRPQVANSSSWWIRLSVNRGSTIRLNWQRSCRRCGTKMLTTEPNKSKWCCFEGRFPLLRLPPYPPNLDRVLANGKASGISRKLNNLFCFSTIGVNGDFLKLPTPSNVVLCGRTYHRMLDIERGQHPLRWFLYASEDRQRAAMDVQVDSSIVRQIELAILHSNPYIEKFRHLRDQPPGVPYALELKNQPASSNEIAAILHINTISVSSPRSVYVWRNDPTSNEGEFVNVLSSHYEPLQYPLLFPHGSPGWSIDFHPKLTQMKYYRMRLLQNDDRFRSLGRLNNEYLVDMFSRMEEERLQYRRHGLIQRAGGEKDIDYNLGSNWIGSRAWASEQVADSLALCREFGRPSLFITVTTNPNWPEIKERLYPAQSAFDQPGVVARAFKARLSLMMKAIS